MFLSPDLDLACCVFARRGAAKEGVVAAKEGVVTAPGVQVKSRKEEGGGSRKDTILCQGMCGEGFLISECRNQGTCSGG